VNLLEILKTCTRGVQEKQTKYPHQKRR